MVLVRTPGNTTQVKMSLQYLTHWQELLLLIWQEPLFLIFFGMMGVASGAVRVRLEGSRDKIQKTSDKSGKLAIAFAW